MKMIMLKVFKRPLKRLGRTFMNILIFDMAAGVYGYAKGWFREPRAKPRRDEDEEIIREDLGDRKTKYRRRW